MISSIYGKALGHLVRFSGIISLLNTVFTILHKNMEVLNNSSEEYLNYLESQKFEKQINLVKNFTI